MTTESAQGLLPFGSGKAISGLPVTRRGSRQIVSDAFINAYFQELLGPRTYGAVLNVGAGTLSAEFSHGSMFNADAFHTFETPDCNCEATYKGTVYDMGVIAEHTYDWVISTAMLEHLEDPWAAAREMLRITKPGGFIYMVAPFSQIVHFEPRYSDFWRFTPRGLTTLFPGTAAREVEAWGESPARPNAFAVLLQKTGNAGPAIYEPKDYYWLEFDNEQPWQIFLDEPRTTFDWPVYRLLIEPMSLAHQLHNARNEYGLKAGLTVRYDDVARAHKHQYARLIGTLGCRDGSSFFESALG